MDVALPTLFEHASDVMRAAVSRIDVGERVAIAIVTRTEGGGVRAPGAMMAICESGDGYGYVSGGCIDGDVIAQAQRAIASGSAISLTYGANSPFMDIRLPCGGAIDLRVLPNPDLKVLTSGVEALDARQTIRLYVSEAGLSYLPSDGAQPFDYAPKLKLRIAGRGQDPIALARLAAASGVSAELWSPDAACLEQAQRSSIAKTRHLKTADQLPASRDDSATAFVLMFHDTDWEPALLEDALAGDAFYIGAVGSKSTHDKRRASLAARGVSNQAIDRINGPIGLVPSMRDASMLAVSAFAEIVGAFHAREGAA